jgi:DNA-binding protein HU-beta
MREVVTLDKWGELKMARMNKSELIANVAAEAALQKDQTARAIDAVCLVIAEQLRKGGEVRITDFGTFSVSNLPARKGRNPQTGEEIDIAASRAAKFKPGRALKDRLNPPQMRQQPPARKRA